jgi:hypothetical protein
MTPELPGRVNSILHVVESSRLRQLFIISWSHAIGRSSFNVKPQPATGGLCTHTTTTQGHTSPIHLTLTTSSHHSVHLYAASQNCLFLRIRAKSNIFSFTIEMSHENRSFVGARIIKYGRSCRTALYKTRALFATQMFPYMALDSNLKEIRVLQVAPGAGLDIITCTLKHISLLGDQIPCYETISYCWGLTRNESIMQLNGSLISVPSSSEAAVRRMRLIDKPRVLWIDAICIDQSSQSEKSEQVALMSTVYTMGYQNLIYLGEDDTGFADRACRTMHSLIPEIWAEYNNMESWTQAIYDDATNVIATSDESVKTDVDFPALESFFDRAWFT